MKKVYIICEIMSNIRRAPRIYFNGDQMKIYKAQDNIIAYTGEPHIELCGISQCIVDGLKGITEYRNDKIRIDLGKYSVSIFGSELFINAFTKEGAVVEGTVISLEFESNG